MFGEVEFCTAVSEDWLTTTQLPKPASVTNDARQRFIINLCLASFVHDAGTTSAFSAGGELDG